MLYENNIVAPVALLIYVYALSNVKYLKYIIVIIYYIITRLCILFILV